jgi:hypothetical protein
MMHPVHGHPIDEPRGINDKYLMNWVEDMIACMYWRGGGLSIHVPSALSSILSFDSSPRPSRNYI